MLAANVTCKIATGQLSDDVPPSIGQSTTPDKDAQFTKKTTTILNLALVRSNEIQFPLDPQQLSQEFFKITLREIRQDLLDKHTLNAYTLKKPKNPNAVTICRLGT